MKQDLIGFKNPIKNDFRVILDSDPKVSGL